MVFQSVVTILLLLFYFHWTHSSLKEKFKEWDQRTTTIEDFTICVKINQKLYDKFILNEYKQTPNDNPIFAFKAYLRNEISKLINQGNASDQQNDSQIVDIEFTFSNILLLELMQKRANAIEEGNNEKRIEIEKEVVKEYSKNHFIPKVAYVIFETEDAYQNALKLGVNTCCCYSSAKQKINDVKIYAQSPYQPTNTEWENCHKTKTEKLLRVLIAIILMGFVILIGFGLLYITEENKETMHAKYPPIDCKIVKMEAGSDENLLQFAEMEWKNIYKHGLHRNTIKDLSTSNLQCYCDKLREEVGWNQAANKIFNIQLGKRDYRGKLCQDYLVSEMVITFGYIIIPIIIEVINIFVKIFIHISGKILKFENKTYEECVIFLLEFLLTFFDSTALILLINANFEGSGIPITFFEGYYTDFTGDWYIHVAPIFLISMFLKMIIPIIKFISLYSVIVVYKKVNPCAKNESRQYINF